MELIIVRHARPLASRDSADPHLSDIGHEQAKLVGDRLQHEPITHIVSSTMVRAIETAEPLATLLDLDVETRDDLREAGEHHGTYTPSEEMAPDDPEALAWLTDPDSMFPGGYDSFKARVTGAFDDIVAANQGSTVAVFCHGMVMASYLDALWGLSSPVDMLIDYTGLFRVRASSTGRRSVRSVNETGHVSHLLKGFGSEAPKTDRS